VGKEKEEEGIEGEESEEEEGGRAVQRRLVEQEVEGAGRSTGAFLLLAAGMRPPTARQETATRVTVRVTVAATALARAKR